jgi:amino-acid N-acetyltransferase
VLRAARTGASLVIEPAQGRDLPAVRDLLERSHLPLDGVDDHLPTMLVAREGAEIVGTAALELYADCALLRSVAVDPRQQGRRLGHALTEAALRLARDHGVDTVFLLTTTAERFFPKFGFEPIARDDVPASVRASIEFQSACPASAIVMRKTLA